MKRSLIKVLAWLCTLSICLSCAAMAVEGTVVDASALRVRSGTSTSSEIVGKVYSGDKVEVTGKIGDWYIIDFNGESRYVSAEYIDIGDVGVQNSMGTITGKTVNVRSAPGTNNSVIGKLIEGTNVSVVGIEGGWFKIKFLDLTGFVHPDYLSVNGLVLTSIAEGSGSSSSVSSVNQTLADKIIAYAYSFIGTPYVYGGSTPDGFDCSGFTQYVFANFGYKLKRTSSDQYSNGTAVSYSELKPCDLVFFSSGSKAIGHVGMYIGDGYFIHATSPGDIVRVTDLSSDYYTNHYVGARRII